MKRSKKIMSLILVCLVFPLFFTGCKGIFATPPGQNPPGVNPPIVNPPTPPDDTAQTSDLTFLEKIITVYRPEAGQESAQAKADVENVRINLVRAVMPALIERAGAIIAFNDLQPTLPPEEQKPLLQPWNLFDEASILAVLDDVAKIDYRRVGLFDAEAEAFFLALKDEILGITVGEAIVGYIDNLLEDERSEVISDGTFFQRIYVKIIDFLSNSVDGKVVKINGAPSPLSLRMRPVLEMDVYYVEEAFSVFDAKSYKRLEVIKIINQTPPESKKQEDSIIAAYAANGKNVYVQKEVALIKGDELISIMTYYEMPKKQYLGVVYTIRGSGEDLYCGGLVAAAQQWDWDKDEDVSFNFLYNSFSKKLSVATPDYHIPDDINWDAVPEELRKEQEELMERMKVSKNLEYTNKDFDLNTTENTTAEIEAARPGILRVKRNVMTGADNLANLKTNIFSSCSLNLITALTPEEILAGSDVQPTLECLLDNSSLSNIMVISFGCEGYSFSLGFLSVLKLDKNFPR